MATSIMFGSHWYKQGRASVVSSKGNNLKTLSTYVHCNIFTRVNDSMIMIKTSNRQPQSNEE